MTYDELKKRFEEIQTAENPEDAGALILSLQSDLARTDDENAELKDKIKELESDIVAKKERIDNLMKRNEELRFSLGRQYEESNKDEKAEAEEIDRDKYEIANLNELKDIL